MCFRPKSGVEKGIPEIIPILYIIAPSPTTPLRAQKKRDRLLATPRGWKMGLEPTTPGTTIQCSNRLSYIHHAIRTVSYRSAKIIQFLVFAKKMGRKLNVSKWQSHVTNQQPASAKSHLAHRLLYRPMQTDPICTPCKPRYPTQNN